MRKIDRAYRVWVNQLKYISRIKKNMYYWMVRDDSAPKGWRRPKNWKELDSDSKSKVKLYKKTSKFWRDKGNQIDAHRKVKTIREETKNILRDIDDDTLQRAMPTILQM